MRIPIRPSFSLLPYSVVYIVGALLLNFLKSAGATNKTFLMLWMLTWTCVLGVLALKSTAQLTRRVRIGLHITIAVWVIFAYVTILHTTTFATTLLWLTTPLICMFTLLLVPLKPYHVPISLRPPQYKRFVITALITMGAILLASLFVRTIHLGALGYSTDEGSTALYAWAINETGVPCNNDICYLRGLPYLYTVAAFTGFFGLTESWVRFAGVFLELCGVIMALVCIQHFWKNWRLTLLGSVIFALADWQIMLGRYARMYGTMLFFLLVALYAYSKTFGEKKYRFLPLLCIAAALSMLTHQFGMLLIFFIIAPLISGQKTLYRNPVFLCFAVFMLIITFVTLTKIPGIIYLSDSYRSLYELRPDLLIQDKYWYLQNLQLPNLVYLKNIFLYYPVSMVLCVFATGYLLKHKHQHRFTALFVCWVLFITTIYRIDYALKYLWWILAVIHIVAVFGLFLYWKGYRWCALAALTLLSLQLVYGDYVIFSREYGKDTTRLPILMPTHVEEYYPDDKTPAEYVAKHAAPEDIVITDYWMQDVYLQTHGHRMSDARILRWDYKEFLNKFPYYQLYDDNGTWRLEKNGPIILSSIKSFTQFLQANQEKTIWYISSVDFKKKKYLYISKPELNGFIEANFSDDIMYTGKDQNSVVYKISF